MMTAATIALFVSAATISVTTIVTTIAPQRHRIVRILLRGPEWTVKA